MILNSNLTIGAKTIRSLILEVTGPVTENRMIDEGISDACKHPIQSKIPDEAMI